MTLGTTAPTPRKRLKDQTAWRLATVYEPSRGSAGESVVLSSAPLRIGRAADSGLVLDDDEVSRLHAVLEVDGETGERVVRDQGSQNGTLLNGAPVERAAVHDGDVIRVGKHLLLVQELSGRECRLALDAPMDSQSIVGPSIRMGVVRSSIGTAATAEHAVLIVGESGVGKELVAQEIHRLSGRSGAFVPVNCAALPEHLVESELFGHARGAYSGASSQTEGLFGEADRGTLFLDEIGEMPIHVQPKLLRALATGEVRGVGETRSRHVDTRFVAATNVDMEAAVSEGRFREDLYARLMGHVIRVPPLRDRREDVLPLARHFLSQERCAAAVTPDAAEALLIHRWPFNVRELEQVIRGSAPLAREAESLDLVHLPDKLQEPLEPRGLTMPPGAPVEAVIAMSVRRDAVPTAKELEQVLEYFAGNVARVAEFFGKDRRQVYRWASRLGVDLDKHRVD